MHEPTRDTSTETPIDDAPESARHGDELMRSLARLKLRLEVCLRRDREAGEYKDTLASCLDDVDGIVRAAAIAVHRARAPRERSS